ncbi:MAG: hypothetical protein R6V83_03985 [Candidatus Thorarchaeota archaeon]
MTVHDLNMSDEGDEGTKVKHKRKRYLLLLPKREEHHKKIGKFLKSNFALKKQVTGVYVVRGSPRRLRDLLADISHIILTGARQIPKENDDDSEGEFRAYKIVAYSLPKSTVQQRKRVQRLCEKSGGLKIQRGVLLFPHLRKREHKRFYSEGNKTGLLDAKRTSESISKAGVPVSRWARLRPLGTKSNDVLERLIASASRAELKRLNKRIARLSERSKNSGTKIESLKSTYSGLRNQIKRMRTKYALLHRMWGVDAKKEIHSSYNKLLRVKKYIKSSR